MKSYKKDGIKKGKKPNPFLGRRRETTIPHGVHSHHTETALQICEYGVEKWLEMQREAVEEAE